MTNLIFLLKWKDHLSGQSLSDLIWRTKQDDLEVGIFKRGVFKKYKLIQETTDATPEYHLRVVHYGVTSEAVQETPTLGRNASVIISESVHDSHWSLLSLSKMIDMNNFDAVLRAKVSSAVDAMTLFWC